jgi:predicted Zn finger-like uncharacterized protein
MITRCPSCQTAFRVNDAQLAARNGQVRCGACANIFDARAFLVPEVPEAADAATAPVAAPLPATETVAEYEPFVPDLPDINPPATNAAPEEVETQGPQALATPAAALPPLRESRSSDAASITFGPDANIPARRGPWVAGIMLLLLLFFAQALFHFRNDIALLVPESKPLLKDACAMLGCSISLPRRSELMSIESSDLQADGANPNVVVLTATLRNRAAFAQAHPALELTLTDSQDLPLARRVLQAVDYLDAAPDNDSGFAAGAERPIKLTLQLADIKATGYRLYLFYP